MSLSSSRVHATKILAASFACTLAVACQDSSATPDEDGGSSSTNDAAAPATQEAGGPDASAGPDAAKDAAPPPSDSGRAPADAGADAAQNHDAGARDAGGGDDASTSSGGDAGATDASSGGDAATPCVGHWTMIPPLTVAGAAVTTYDVITNDDGTIYVAYSRPSDPTFLDVASYTPGSGWTAYQSSPALDVAAGAQRPVWAVPESGHLAGFSIGSDSAVWRQVFDFASQKWTVANTGSLQPSRSGVAYTKDWIVFEGEYSTPATGVCDTRTNTAVLALDATNTQKPPSGGSSPLGSLAGPYGIATKDHVFFFGGYDIPYYSGCEVQEPRTPLYDAAFYDPAHDVWSTAVPLGPSAGSTYTWYRLAALPNGQVVLFENYTNVYGRANLLAPGQTSFTSTGSLPSGLPQLLDDAAHYATLAGTAAGVVVWAASASTGVLYDPSTNTTAPICAPPSAVANTYMAPTSNGVVLLGNGQVGTSSTTSQSAYLTF